MHINHSRKNSVGFEQMELKQMRQTTDRRLAGCRRAILAARVLVMAILLCLGTVHVSAQQNAQQSKRFNSKVSSSTQRCLTT